MTRAFLAGIAVVAMSNVCNAQRAESPSPSPAPLIPFVLPWDDGGAADSVTNLSGWLDAPAGRAGFVAARDGHFYAGEKRIRFLGVNLCFGANFPTHEDAEKVAARMARFGINCVRFHHMDTSDSPDGLLKSDRRTIDPDRLDRLDYLIAQFKKHGIYADLNLHVGRHYPGMPSAPGMASFFKGIDLFYPDMIRMQKDYARELLTHVNPYTKTRYVDEPAVALVEINNENGLIEEWLSSSMDNLPEPLAAELTRQWNAWLAKKYPTHEALAKAWSVGEKPLGDSLLVNSELPQGVKAWTLEHHDQAKAGIQAVKEGPNDTWAAKITTIAIGRETWNVQLSWPDLAFKKDEPYTLTFQAKAEVARTIGVGLFQAHDPWHDLAHTRVRLTDQWQTFTLVLMPGEDEKVGRLMFTPLGDRLGSVWLATVSLRPGGLLGLHEGEKLGSIPMFRKADMCGRTVPAQRDWMRFMYDTEAAYWTGMRDFIKTDCGSKSIVVGTIVGCSTPNLMAAMDAIDTHGYWQHPHFPRKQWDMNDWTVNNVSMVNSPAESVPGELAVRRVLGKPLICTEYNHAAPNTFAGEAPLMLAAMAGAQDWDGVFLFAYSHRRDNWDAQHICSFFDIDQHPTKMANLPIAAAMFFRGDVRPDDKLAVCRIGPDDELELLRTRGQPWHLVTTEYFGIPRFVSLLHRVAIEVPGISPAPNAKQCIPPDDLVALARGPASPRTSFVSDTGELTWDVTRKDQGVVTVNAPRTKMLAGFVDGRSFTLGDVVIAPGPTRQDWCTISLTLAKGDSFSGPCRVLLVATGYTENTAMGWKDSSKNTVGRNWGRSPSVVEVIPAEITLPVPAAKVSAWALDERGQRGEKLIVKESAGKAAIQIGPPSKTVWYEVVVE